MGMPAARLSDMHICPMVTGLVPHVGGPVLPTCSINVLTGMLPQARVTDMATCVGPPDILVKGSPTVLVNNLPAVRILVDTTAHGGMIVVGCFTVLIGDGGGAGGGGGGGAPGVEKNAIGNGGGSGGGGDGGDGAGAGATPVAVSATAVEANTSDAAQLLDRVAQGNSGIKIDGSPEFQRKTLDGLARLARTPTGLGLLQDLDDNGQTVKIMERAGEGPSQMPLDRFDGLRDPLTRQPNKGTRSVVKWDPERVTIGDGSERWHNGDPAIGLGHELIHAYHDAHGTSDGLMRSYVDAFGQTRKAMGYELQAVGLDPYQDNLFTENKLRQEFRELGVGINGNEAQRPYY